MGSGKIKEAGTEQAKEIRKPDIRYAERMARMTPALVALRLYLMQKEA
jgi:hypothetical protein